MKTTIRNFATTVTICGILMGYLSPASEQADETLYPVRTQGPAAETATTQPKDTDTVEEKDQPRTDQTEKNGDTPLFIGVVTADTLNVRVKPHKNSSVLCRISAGDEVNVFEQEEQWYKIAAPSQARAWIAKQFVTGDGEIQKEGLRVRAGAAVAFTPYGVLHKGDRVKLEDVSRHGWQQIEAPATARAWVSAKYIERVSAEETKTAGVTSDSKPHEEDEAERQEEQETSSASPQEKTTEDQSSEKTSAPQPSKHTDATSEKKPREQETEAEAEQIAAPEIQDTGEKTREKEPLETQKNLEMLSALNDARPPAGTVREAARTGIIVPLENRATETATHVLARRGDGITYPVCFLISPTIELDRWSMKRVHVSGQEHWYENWERPLLKVSGVQIAR